tara:strand:+ start:66 stop:353 length:288 start_codon:yes stop_codon:yes gene_type:complete
MEESKAPEFFRPNLSNNDIRQCAYMLSKTIPSNNIINLSFDSILVKNNRKIACIRTKDDNLSATIIINGKKQCILEFNNYDTLVYSITKIIYSKF